MGEFDLINSIKEKIKNNSKDVIVGIGDDCAVLEKNKEEYQLITTDSLVEQDHFNLQWSTPEQVGKKAIEQSVSDIAAMGGTPEFVLVSLGLKDQDQDFIDKLYNGINEKLQLYNINLIGGNITHSNQIFINITMLGSINKNKVALRKNAKIRDLIYCSGSVGSSTTGLELLRSNLKGNSITHNLEPTSRLKLSHELTQLGIKCMIDVSDGVAPEVKHICTESNLGAIIKADKLPISQETINDCKQLNKDPIDFALYGGEDYELVFTAPIELKEKLKDLDVTEIGIITDKDIKIKINNELKDIESGFDHFKRLRV